MDSVLQGIYTILEALVNLAGAFITAIADLFNLDLSSGQAQVIGAVVLILFVLYAINWFYWSIANAASFKPQIVALPTKRTPWDVVWTDASNCLLRILVLGLIFLVRVVFFRACQA